MSEEQNPLVFNDLNPFQRARINISLSGFIFGIIVAIIVLFFSLRSFDGSEIPLVRVNGFAEWDRHIHADDRLFEAHPCPNRPDVSGCNGGEIFQHNLTGAGVIFRSFYDPPVTRTNVDANFLMDPMPDGTYEEQPDLHIVWMLRLITVVIFFGNTIFYRQFLGERFKEENRSLAHKVFTELSGGFDIPLIRRLANLAFEGELDSGESSKPLAVFIRVLFMLLTLFVAALIAYVVMTLLSLPLIMMFIDLQLSVTHTVMLVTIYGAVAGYGTMYLLSAANTSEMLIFSLGAIVIALGGLFVLAENRWWMSGAISQTGVDDATSALFSNVIAMLAFVLGFIWYDLSKYVKHIIAQDYTSKPQSIPAKISASFLSLLWLIPGLIWFVFREAMYYLNTLVEKAKYGSDYQDGSGIPEDMLKDYHGVNGVVTAAVLILLLVGIFPNTWNYPAFDNIHNMAAYGGIGLFLVITKLAFVHLIAKHKLPEQLITLAAFTLLLDIIFIVLRFSSGSFSINTTAIEVWMLLSISAWVTAVTALVLETINTIEETS